MGLETAGKNTFFFIFFLKGGNISMVVIYYARDIIEYDGRRPELSNAALHMK